MKRNLWQRLSLMTAVILALCSPIAAQNVTGAITGVVRDPSQSFIPGALVSARNQATGATFQSKTDAEGAYWLRNLPVGLYALSVEHTGFQRFEAKDLRLQVNDVLRLDVALQVGSTTETVTVVASPTTVDTTTATLKAVVDQRRIENLPLNGRDPLQLMRLIGGVTTDRFADVTSGTTYPGVVPVSVNGGRANMTNYILDGANHNDNYNNAPSPFPNPDALQEFSVQTNNFSAEFGRQAGGVVNAVTKSGTNQLHGSLFEYLRNHRLNAANFFAPVSDGKKVDDGLKRNQFGGTLGGPVVLPKLYDGRNKTFFFLSNQVTLIRRRPATALRVVPTAEQKRGDFSALPRPLRDPLTGQPYPGNQIPPSQFNPVSKHILDQRLATPPPGTNRITTRVPMPTDEYQILVRGDHAFLNDSNRLFGRYFRSRRADLASLNPRNVIENHWGGDWINESVSVSDTHSFSATLVNQVLFSYNSVNGWFNTVQPGQTLAELGIKYYNDPKSYYWDINVAGYFQIITYSSSTFPRHDYQILDTLRWTKGRHQIVIGGEYSRGKNDIANNFRASGVWSFNGAAGFTGDSLADFLIGRFESMTQGIGEYKNNRIKRLSMFVQDSWKVSRRFTLDLGVRWEPFIPYTDTLGKLAVWRPAEQSRRYPNAPRGILYPGDPNIPDGTVPSGWTNFGPRFGFAWDAFGDGKTAIRGGYGVFYDWLNTISTNAHANQAPFGTVVTVFGSLTNSFSDPWAGTTNPFPAPRNPPSTVIFPQYSTQFVNAPDFRMGYLQSWNLTVEREFVGGFLGRVSYAGSKGTRFVAPRELNAAVYVPGATIGTTNQRRPLGPALGSTTIVEPVSNSTFHAVQLHLERRFARGFTVLTNYQFAKAMDDASLNKGGAQVRANPQSQRFDKGLADFHRTHVFNFSGLWALPVRPARALTRALLGGWNLTGIIGLSSGPPMTIFSGVDNARTGTPRQRADILGDPYLGKGRPRGEKILEWLRRSAFAPNALGTFGNLGRNTYFGPGFATVDLGLLKDFALGERVTAQFRFEAFNALNRVNLNNPTTSQNHVNFMRITSAQDPRILQFALRLEF